MNKILLKSILAQKDLFVPLIFTQKQFFILKKYNANLKLDDSEKKSLYTSIKKKIQALNSLSIENNDNEYFFNNPNEMIKERIITAKSIIDSYIKSNNKVFISGSFLFSKKFNDIDIFIIRKKGYKEKWDENKHIIYLSEKRLSSPIFQSSSLISISNFIIPKKIKRKSKTLHELMSTYHEAVIEFIRKENKPESIRSLIFDYYLFYENKILNGKELQKISKKIRLEDLSRIITKLCKKLFSKTYLYVEIHTYINTLKESIKNIKPNNHLIMFRNTYEEMIYGRQRSKAEAN